MESLIVNDLTDFLLGNNLISRQQHGFIKKRSTTSNLLESLNDWTISLSRRTNVIVAYIDFARAFDSICHSKLILKLRSYGISGNLLSWLTSFLVGRMQCVRVGTALSDFRPVSSGIPQGSCLGPWLFLIFINDITDNLGPEVSSKLFADDIKLYTQLSNPSSSVNFQTQLNIISAWSVAWQLPISHSKCCLLEIGRNLSSPPLHISSVCIPYVNQVKDLGVHIERDFKFTQHINIISSRACQRGCQILRRFLSRNTSSLVRAYKVFVRALIEYASVTWSPSQKQLINNIENVQRAFTRRLPGLKFLSYRERLENLKLQSLEHRRLITDLIACFNIVHGLNSLSFNDFFTKSTNPSSRGHSLRLLPPLVKNNTDKAFFSARVVRPWNSLPESVVNAANAKSFKHYLLSIDLSQFLTFPCILIQPINK